MKKTVVRVIMGTFMVCAWLLGVTPRPTTHSHVYNLTPVCSGGTCTLTVLPNPVTSVRVYVNGIRHKSTEDYTVSITTTNLVITPVSANLALYMDPTTIFVVDLNQ